MQRRYKKKIIPISAKMDTTEVVIENKISITACRKVLKDKAKQYTDEQIGQIRDFFTNWQLSPMKSMNKENQQLSSR